MKKITSIFILFLIFSCSSEDSAENVNEQEQENATFSLIVENEAVIPFQYVKVTSSDIVFNQNEYTGSLGGNEIQLSKLSDNELIFSIPDVEAGSQVLSLTVDNRVGQLNFQISSNQVQQVNEVLNTELLDPLNEFSQNINTLLSDGNISIAATQRLNTAHTMLDDFLQKFNSLSDAEKLEIARFYNANPLFTTDYLNLDQPGINGGDEGYNCFKTNSERVVLTTVSILGFVAVLPHLTAVGPLGSIGALVGFVAGVYAAHSIISAAHELLLHECFIPFKHALSDGLGNSDNFESDNNVFSNYTLTAEDRHMIASDIANSNFIVSYTIEKINVVKGKWNRLTNGVNGIISDISNWFNGWFSTPTEYDLITYEFEEIPSVSEEIESDGNSDFITIEDFPSDVEVEMNIVSTNSINLRLNANESTLPRTVTGKIKYNDGDFTTEDEFSVLLEQVTDSTAIYEAAVIGTWTVHTLSSPADPYDLTIQPNGEGFYYVEGGANSDDGMGTYYIDWNIYYVNGRYFLRENGFYHVGFEQFRVFDITLPDNPLSFPVSSFKTYSDLNDGNGSNADRLYVKN